MNAIKFIQQHGIDKARGAMTSAHVLAHQIWDDQVGLVDLSDLKRLVDSVDYVAIHGYEKSKDILKNAPVGAECYSWLLGNSGVRDKTVELVKLKQAIADYEAIGGEHV